MVKKLLYGGEWVHPLHLPHLYPPPTTTTTDINW